MFGRTLTIFLVEGTIDGLHTAEIDNWVGKVMVAPRSDLPALLSQSEAGGLGAYVLVGNDPDTPGGKRIYIGQGNVKNRLTQHSSDRAKELWDDKTIVIVASNSILNTAHCLHLESRLLELAGQAAVATILNGQYPATPTLSAADKALVENFLAQTQVLLPVLGISFFVAPPKVSAPPLGAVSSLPLPNSDGADVDLQEQSPLFMLVTTKGKNTVIAEAQLIQNKFVVRQGATVSANTSTLTAAYAAQRAQLRQSGRLVDDSQTNKWTLIEDIVFASPSAAAAVICGYNINGPQTWKVKGTQQTYADWLEAQVFAVSS